VWNIEKRKIGSSYSPDPENVESLAPYLQDFSVYTKLISNPRFTIELLVVDGRINVTSRRRCLELGSALYKEVTMGVLGVGGPGFQVLQLNAVYFR
jgi:hypothetical protein